VVAIGRRDGGAAGGAAAAGEEDKNPRFGCEMCWEGEEYIEANVIGRLGFV